MSTCAREGGDMSDKDWFRAIGLIVATMGLAVGVAYLLSLVLSLVVG